MTGRSGLEPTLECDAFDAVGLIPAAERIADAHGISMGTLLDAGSRSPKDRPAAYARWELWHAMHAAGWKPPAIGALFGARYGTVWAGIKFHIDRNGGAVRWPVPAPPSGGWQPSVDPRRLPIAPSTDGVGMLRGQGDRRDDCTRYDDCLGAFVRGLIRNAMDPGAHCPALCLAYAPVPREFHLAVAHSRGESAIAQCERLAATGQGAGS